MIQLRSFWLALAVSVVVGIVLLCLPLVSVHGVESALLLGILLPPWAAALGASYACTALTSTPIRGVDVMLRAIGAGLSIWCVPVFLLALNALRVRQCAPLEGLTFMMLGPGLGCALAAISGVWIAAITQKRSFAPWIAAMIPVCSVLFGLWVFYATPAIYIFTVFAGYFPGTIYDSIVQIPIRYLVYRATSLIFVLSFVLLFDAWWNPQLQRLGFRVQASSRLLSMIFAIVGLLCVAGIYAKGNHLGYYTSTASIVERLGRTELGQGCIVHLPRETPHAVSQRIVEDCDFNVLRMRTLLGIKKDEPITAFFFRNADEKKVLMGAGKTLIAKPWRHEVYLQMHQWPHPVMAHEIAHAVLADVSRPPFRVAARWRGLLPNPGLIEGAAVALAWDVREGMDPDQWSRIMMDKDILPSVSQLMSLSFTGLPARRAYSAAGSLVRFMIESRGMDRFIHAYHEGTIKDPKDLEKQWHEFLQKVEVTSLNRGIAEVALGQQSILNRVCPHQLAKLENNLKLDLRAHDDAAIIETSHAILKIDKYNHGAHAALVGAYARTQRIKEAKAELDVLVQDPNTVKPILALALEELADAEWKDGRIAQARQLYEELLALPQSEDKLRNIELKRLALEENAEQQKLLLDLLIGRPFAPIVVHLAQRLSDTRKDGLGAYLEARQLIAQHRYDLGLPLLERAKRLGLPTERLRNEQQRLWGIALFAVHRYDESRRVWLRREHAGPAVIAEAERWLERITQALNQGISLNFPGSLSVHQAEI